MSEIKRKENEEKSKVTFRINLNLFEPNAKAFPEFNWNNLINKEKVRKLSV
jgi:hypothetical protein